MSFEGYSQSLSIGTSKPQETASKIMASRRSLRNTSFAPPKSINAKDFYVCMRTEG